MFPSPVPGVLCPALGIDAKHHVGQYESRTMSDSELDSGTVIFNRLPVLTFF